MAALGRLVCVLSFLVIGLNCARGDTPANCTYEDIVGKWVFLEGDRASDSSIDCNNFQGPYTNKIKLDLRFPNVAFDENGNKGYWTIVYNQGFEVVINYRKYFAFSYYENTTRGEVVSYCNATFNGWSHDVLGKNWACYYGRKTGSAYEPKISALLDYPEIPMNYIYSEDYVDQINSNQNSWTAKLYPELKHMSIKDLIRRSGGIKSRIHSPPPPFPIHPILKRANLLRLPKEFDWRNVKGVNYVSSVKNQGSCGSCYAFSSLGMLESRLRIMTNNSLQVDFSPQDVVSCSEYSQGCEGGFPYVIAGKYAQDFGVVPELCFPYAGQDGNCTERNCKRYYVADYKYVGGFFGGCNEELMKLDLIQNGPMTVAMEVYEDFQLYRGGIYHHTGVGIGFNPFHLVNHGVLIVGYGISNETGEKFWIVKNSWGPEWGESGFFRIRRGTNECNIESMAVSAIPIP